jgi:hypothetical protein
MSKNVPLFHKDNSSWGMTADCVPIPRPCFICLVGCIPPVRRPPIWLSALLQQPGLTIAQVSVGFVRYLRLSCMANRKLASATLFLGAFAKSRKATITFVLSVRPSVRPHGRTRLPLDGFSWNLIFQDFSKNLSRKFQVSLKYGKNNRYFTWRPKYMYDMSLNSSSNLKCFTQKCTTNQNTHFMFSNIFPNIKPFVR